METWFVRRQEKKYRESVYKSIKRSFEKQKETNPEKFEERYEKVMSYNRERTANETPEQRQKRLLRYKVNQAKRRAKSQMEKEGPQEEIERLLEEVRREVEQRESSKPNKEYMPRVGARKSKMLIKLEEQLHQPSTVSVDDINSSVVQVLPPPPPQLDQPPPESFIHPDLDYPQFLPSPMAQDDDDNYDDCDYQPPHYEPNVPEPSSENIPELDLSSPLKVEVEEASTIIINNTFKVAATKRNEDSRDAPHNLRRLWEKFECKTATSLWKHYVNFHEEAEVPIPTTKVKPSSSKSIGVSDKQAVRDRGGPVTCDQCGKQYKQRATLDDHIRRVHLSQRFFCDVCSKEEQTATKLWRHKKDKHGTDEPPPAEMVVCDYCGEQVLRSYGHHVQRRHPEKYDEYLESIGALRNPSSNNFSIATVTVKCSECQREILHSSLKRHMRSVHKRDSRKFQCQQCGQEFTEMYGLKDHTGNLHTINFIKKKMEAKNLIKMQMESGRRIFYCSLCDAKFTSKVDVGGHFLAQHFDIYEQLNKPAEGQNWKCEECSKEFLSDALFSSH
ncbi:Zinc finger and BTB domain-containing protein 17 [Orchesella cincta]|uniref:Zinc finger and BTB domain-containing protein 17 n=1 Tax=Orchesella cincta TaxID=48709 RepID=A0A1D2M664_ORCCI|nr:Zinc finger and BTB domain-containing protein 17 [Orchesella cincta]